MPPCTKASKERKVEKPTSRIKILLSQHCLYPVVNAKISNMSRNWSREWLLSLYSRLNKLEMKKALDFWQRHLVLSKYLCFLSLQISQLKHNGINLQSFRLILPTLALCHSSTLESFHLLTPCVVYPLNNWKSEDIRNVHWLLRLGIYFLAEDCP